MNPVLLLRLISCHRLVTATILLLALSGRVPAPENAMAQSEQASPPGILIATSDAGVRYLVGGVGADERKAMEQLSGDYNVKFVFADTFGEYMSDVAVRIDDFRGKTVVRLVTNGPWLYVKLAPGGYRVRATHAARTVEIERLEVPNAAGVRLTLGWNLDGAAPGAGSR
jgi:hypothetical protein